MEQPDDTIVLLTVREKRQQELMEHYVVVYINKMKTFTLMMSGGASTKNTIIGT